MGFVVDYVQAGWDWISSVAVDVWDVVCDLVGVVVTALNDPAIQIILLAILAVTIIGPAIYAAYVDAAIAAAAAEGAAATAWAATSTFVTSFSTSLALSFKALLEAIHFKTVLALHNVAMLVSTSYRAAMMKVYQRLADVSQALGFWPQFISIAIRNVRTLVLDASTTMGRKYDLAEVGWLTDLNGALTKMSDRMTEYKNNPEELFLDLDEWLVAPAMDAKGSFMATVIMALDGTIKVTNSVVTSVVTLSDDLARLVADLPDTIKSHIQPYTKAITDRVDEFIDRTYLDDLNILSEGIGGLKDSMGLVEGRAEDIEGRIDRPGGYMSEIDGLSTGDRRYQEMVMYNLTDRHLDDQKIELESAVGADEMKLHSITEAVEFTPAPPVAFPKEVGTIRHPPGVAPAVRTTWNVGDY